MQPGTGNDEANQSEPTESGWTTFKDGYMHFGALEDGKKNIQYINPQCSIT